VCSAPCLLLRKDKCAYIRTCSCGSALVIVRLLAVNESHIGAISVMKYAVYILQHLKAIRFYPGYSQEDKICSYRKKKGPMPISEVRIRLLDILNVGGMAAMTVFKTAAIEICLISIIRYHN
jgi:hypothetical protein